MWHILILLLVISAAKTGWWENSSTLELTDTNYKQIIGTNKFIVLEFYAPWCHFCQHMFPEYEAVWDYYKSPDSNWKRDDVEITRANMQANVMMGKDYRIAEYPTIAIIPPFSGEIIAFFNGERTKIKFINWIDQQIEEYSKNTADRKLNTIEPNEVVDHEHEEDIEDDTFETNEVQYEFVINDQSAEFSKKWKSEFQNVRIELEELRSYLKEQTQELMLLTSSIKSILKDQTLTNMQHFETLEKQAVELDSNIVNRNKIESTQTRFNVTHMVVFIALGTLIGLGIGVVSTKMKAKKSYKFDN